MNTKLYLKQAWELLKQNRLFSTLYIVGTALAIAMTMMMAVIYYVRLAPVYLPRSGAAPRCTWAA